MNNVRIFFSKKGRAKYISHLDMYRLFMRCFKKTTIPIWYTEGFNPHMYMTFPMALSLGFESEKECVDIKLTEEMSFDEIKSQLSSAFPVGIDVLEVSEPVHDQKELAFSDYEIELFLNDDKQKTAKEEFFSACQKDSIIVLKKGKKSGRKELKEVDIKPMFELVSLEEETTADGDALKIVIRCVCTLSKNLNPSLLIGAIFKDEDIRLCRVTRKKLLTENLEEFK